MTCRLDISGLDNRDPTHGDQEMADGREMNFNVQSGKREMTDDREMNFYSGGQEPTLFRLRS